MYLRKSPSVAINPLPNSALPSFYKKRATLAQLVERHIRNVQVAGSIPAGGSSKSGKEFLSFDAKNVERATQDAAQVF